MCFQNTFYFSAFKYFEDNGQRDGEKVQELSLRINICFGILMSEDSRTAKSLLIEKQQKFTISPQNIKQFYALEKYAFCIYLLAVQHKCLLSQSGKAGSSLISTVLIECSCGYTRLLLTASPGTICVSFVRYCLYLKSAEALPLFPLAPIVVTVFTRESTGIRAWTDFALNPFRCRVDIFGITLNFFAS